MINRVYRLVSPKNIKEFIKEEEFLRNQVLIRPIYLSICVADQRYYTGKRAKEVLEKKLPMSLIHEGVGKVIATKNENYNIGDYVVMVPNLPSKKNLKTDIMENYRECSKFRSSGVDGFLQEFILEEGENIQKIPKEIFSEIFSFLELITVSLHSIDKFETVSHSIKNRIAVYGDGNLGFITSLLLKYKYPNSEIILFGKTEEKLRYFSFLNEKYLKNEHNNKIRYDHVFECVGGSATEDILDEIIDNINPQGVISLLGVSENKIRMNTRMILEKGLLILGSSRSSSKDFKNAIEFIEKNIEIIDYLKLLVNFIKPVNNLEDLINIFEQDLIKKWGKTIIEWKI